jgi:GTP-binding protein Era
MTLQADRFSCAQVAIIGRPNAGKSTLLNSMMESELSGVSPRAQTTRKNVRGILNFYSDESSVEKKRWTSQLVLVDTPGVNLRRGLLDRSMYAAIEAALEAVEIVCWVADAREWMEELENLEFDRPGDDRLSVWLKEQVTRKYQAKKWFLVLTKADLVEKAELLPLIEKTVKVIPSFSSIIPVVGKKKISDRDSNLASLVNLLRESSPIAAPLYAEEEWTDLNERELLLNLIREAVFCTNFKEVPYECECQITNWAEAPGVGMRPEVSADIIVSRDSLRAILVGKGGSRIKEIGTMARQRFEKVTGTEIILKMHVKISDRWMERAPVLRELGYDLRE